MVKPNRQHERGYLQPPWWLIALLVVFAAGLVWFFAGDLLNMATNDESVEVNEETADSLETADVVGLEEEDAMEQAEEQEVPARVVSRDGEDLPVTMDFVPERLNLWIEDGEVVDAATDEEMTAEE